MSFVLVELKVTLNLLAQIDTLSRSLFRMLVVSCVSLPNAKSVVSSAKIWGVDSRSVMISLMKSKKRSGPKRDPCGTPASTGSWSDSFMVR